MSSPIVEFYRDVKNESKPCGYAYFDIIHNWSDDDWEGIHDFIQWIFPLKEPSNFNPDAPLLHDDDIALFKADKDLQEALFQSFHRFLKFLGLRCQYIPGVPSPGGNIPPYKWVTSPIVAGQNGDEFFTKAQVEKKMQVWEYPNHNWLRVTRCLHSMRLLGLEYAADSLFEALCKLYDEGRGITPETFKYWQDAAQGGLE